MTAKEAEVVAVEVKDDVAVATIAIQGHGGSRVAVWQDLSVRDARQLKVPSYCSNYNGWWTVLVDGAAPFLGVHVHIEPTVPGFNMNIDVALMVVLGGAPWLALDLL